MLWFSVIKYLLPTHEDRISADESIRDKLFAIRMSNSNHKSFSWSTKTKTRWGISNF